MTILVQLQIKLEIISAILQESELICMLH